MGAFFLAFLNLLLVSQISFAQVKDKIAGDRTETYVNIEFSPDNKYAILMDAKVAQSGTIYRTYLSRVADNGSLIPSSGKGHLIGEASMLGMPQWGLDRAGPYAVMLDKSGNLVLIRPRGSSKPLVRTFVDTQKQELKLMRAFPYPSQNSQWGHQFVTYQIRNKSAQKFQQILVDLSLANPVHRKIYEEAYINGRSPGPIISFARWMRGSSKLFYGAYERACNKPSMSLCPAQVKMLELNGSKIVSNQYVTFDDDHKIDAYPYKEGTKIKLFAGLNLTENGGEFTFDNKKEKFELKKRISLDYRQTDLKQPGAAQSMEPFLWNNDLYVAYQVVDTGLGISSSTASSFPGEIWIYKSSNKETCRVSIRDYPHNPAHPKKRARVDAEAIVTKDGSLAHLYYHSAQTRESSEDLVFDLRLIHLGNKSQFDRFCAL